MRGYIWTLAAMLGATVASVSAGEKWRLTKPRDCAPPPCVSPCPESPLHRFTDPRAPGSPLDPNAPSNPAQMPADSPFNQALASASEAGTQSESSLMPGFFGDLLGGVIDDVYGGSIDVTTASGIKIAEGDSPRPLNRFYYLYNMYGAVPEFAGPRDLSVHRHIIGFEKTFLGGNASIGMRLPIFSLAGQFTSEQFLGDLSVIGKYALINNRETGNLLSIGMVVTAPTGGAADSVDRNYPIYLQPYFGYIYNATSKVFAHGFHSVAVPTTNLEPTFMANSVGLGYWMTRDATADFIRAFVPTFEVHVNTPFTNREPPDNDRVQMLDSVNLTFGATVLLPRSRFGAAVSVPVAFGPHRVEALASYTYYFGARNQFAGR